MFIYSIWGIIRLIIDRVTMKVTESEKKKFVTCFENMIVKGIF